MKSRYFMQSVFDFFEFIGRSMKVEYHLNDGCDDCYKKGQNKFDYACKNGNSILDVFTAGKHIDYRQPDLAVHNYFTGCNNDPDAYEVNGYDESVRKRAQGDITWMKRKRKGDMICFYERPALYQYTYNKGFSGNLRRLVYFLFVSFFVVVSAYRNLFHGIG